MSVLVVVIAGDVELGHLCASLTADGLRFAVLLADQRLDAELTELEVRLDTEKRLTAPDERVGNIHRYITCLDGLDNIILFAFVVQFEVLLVKGERSFGIVAEVEIEAGTDLTLHAGLDLLVKIEDVIVAGTRRQRRIGDMLMLEAEE